MHLHRHDRDAVVWLAGFGDLALDLFGNRRATEIGFLLVARFQRAPKLLLAAEDVSNVTRDVLDIGQDARPGIGNDPCGSPGVWRLP
jgi:hypothetical protein